jgi:hypothetical protein
MCDYSDRDWSFFVCGDDLPHFLARPIVTEKDNTMCLLFSLFFSLQECVSLFVPTHEHEYRNGHFLSPKRAGAHDVAKGSPKESCPVLLEMIPVIHILVH